MLCQPVVLKLWVLGLELDVWFLFLFFLLSQVFEESLFQMRFVSVGCSQVEVK